MKILEKMKYISNGGIEAFVFNTTSKIDNPLLHIDYYSDNAPDEKKHCMNAEKKGRNIILPSRNYRKMCFKPFRVWAKWIDFYRLCKKEKYDIIHIHMCRPYDSMYAAAARLAGKSKIILHSHFAFRTDLRCFEKILNNFFRLLSPKNGMIFLACSDKAAAFMFNKSIIYCKNYIIVKNGIDVDRFSFSEKMRNNIRESYGLKKNFVIGHVGRFAKEKNHSFLLDIFKKASEKNQNCRLLLAGDGELMPQIKQKAISFGIADKIIFCGFVDNTEKLYSAMDCFVFPSLSEGLGIAAVEAQASGLHTICSDTVPSEAAATELCEFLPLSASAEVWADKILSYANGYERRDVSEQIRAAGYDINDTAKKLEEIYIMSEFK